MNFMTAYVVLEVDDSKLRSQLAKVEKVVVKTAKGLENSINRQDKAIKKVNQTWAKSTMVLKDVFGSTIKIEKILGRWSTTALHFYKRMVQNLLILEKFGSAVYSLGKISVKAFVWPFKQAGKALKDLVWPMKKIEQSMKAINKVHLTPINEDMPLPSALDLLFHPAKTIRAAISASKERAGTVDIINEKLKEQNTLLEKQLILHKDVNETIRETEDVLSGQGWVSPAIESFPSAPPVSFKKGKTLYDISGVLVEAHRFAFEKIYNMASRTFGKIYDVIKWTWEKTAYYAKWAAGIVAGTVLAVYYKITDAAMDAEDALSWDELGTTRTSIQRFKDALSGVFAALGKPFLPGIQRVTTAISEWLEKSTPKIAAWADKWVGKLAWLQTGMIKWVEFLSTDFKGGIDVALKVVLEVFRGLGDVLIITMEYIGRKAGEALVDAFTNSASGIMQIIVEPFDKGIKWLDKKMRQLGKETAGRSRTFGAFPDTGPYPGMGLGSRPATEEEKLGGAVSRAARERAENIKAILEGMPTWGDTLTEGLEKDTGDAIKAIEKVAGAQAAMDDHRIKTLEKGGTLAEMEYRLALEKITIQDSWATKSSDSIDRMLKTLDVELEMIGKTTEARKRAVSVMKFEAELAETLGEASVRTAEGQERYNELLDEYSTKLDTVLEAERRINEERDKSLTGWKAVGDSISTWVKKVENWGKTLGAVLTNAFDTMADGLADALMGMEMDWKAFGRMFIKQLLAMIIKMQMLFLWQVMTGTAGMGGGGAVGGSSPGTMGPSNTALGVGLAEGGLVTQSGWAKVDKGERFSGVNNEQGFGTSITINNTQSDRVDVEVEQGVNGEQVINIVQNLLAYDGPTRSAVKQAVRT